MISIQRRDIMLTILYYYLELSLQFKLRKPSFLLGLFTEVSRDRCSVLALVSSGNLLSGHLQRLFLDSAG